MARRRLLTKCKRCNRKLTDLESRRVGYGPKCLLKTGAVVARQLEEAGQLRFPGV